MTAGGRRVGAAARGLGPQAFRSRYGAGLLHLLAAIASFAIATYAFLEIAERPSPVGFALWFAGAIVAHDLIAFPLYSLLGLLAGRARAKNAGEPRSAVNYVRVPALLAGFAFVIWFPLILGADSEAYEAASGRSTDPFLERWLLLTAALFAGSGIVYALRSRLHRAPSVE
ncbi:MAG: hypothetical protein ACRDKX_05610 [Solirubrobacterales bacterium]